MEGSGSWPGGAMATCFSVYPHGVGRPHLEHSLLNRPAVPRTSFSTSERGVKATLLHRRHSSRALHEDVSSGEGGGKSIPQMLRLSSLHSTPHSPPWSLRGCVGPTTRKSASRWATRFVMRRETPAETGCLSWIHAPCRLMMTVRVVSANFSPVGLVPSTRIGILRRRRSLRRRLGAAMQVLFKNPNSRSTAASLSVRARRDKRSEEHTSELQSRLHLVCRLLLEKKKNHRNNYSFPIARVSDLIGRAHA